MLATFLIGLREGLEAALVVGILVAYVTRMGRRDVLPRLWIGVGLAVVLRSASAPSSPSARTRSPSRRRSSSAGSLSLVTVAMVTWMIFWMQKTARTMKATLEAGVDRALASSGLWAVVVIGFISVAREGIETTLLLWSMVQSFGDAPAALLGAVLGLVAAVGLGWLLARGHAAHQPAASSSPRPARSSSSSRPACSPTRSSTCRRPARCPDRSPTPRRSIPSPAPSPWAGRPSRSAGRSTSAAPSRPGGPLAAILQSTVGFMPKMSWLQVIAWVLYVAIVGALFVRGLRAPGRAARRAAASAPSRLRRPRLRPPHHPVLESSVAGRPSGRPPPLPGKEPHDPAPPPRNPRRRRRRSARAVRLRREERRRSRRRARR